MDVRDARETFEDESPAVRISAAHLFHAGLRTSQGGGACVLYESGGAATGLREDQEHIVDDFFGSGTVAEAPAGHGIGFGKTVDDDGAVAKRRRDVMVALVGDALVDFVADEDKVAAFGEVSDGGQFGGGEDRAYRVPGGVEDKNLCAGSPCRFEGFGVEVKASVFEAASDGGGAASGHADGGLVGVVDGVGQEHGIAFIEEGHEGGVDAKGGSVGDENFGGGVVSEVVFAVEFFGDGFAEGDFASVVGVAGASLLEGLNCCFDDVGGGGEIGFAAHEGDGGVTLGVEGADLAQDGVDGRRFEVCDSVCCGWHEEFSLCCLPLWSFFCWIAGPGVR